MGRFLCGVIIGGLPARIQFPVWRAFADRSACRTAGVKRKASEVQESTKVAIHRAAALSREP
ncbi:MAG: hypothetical protein ACYDHM_11585 [Acidiferrobacterales bacterium]